MKSICTLSVILWLTLLYWFADFPRYWDFPPCTMQSLKFPNVVIFTCLAISFIQFSTLSSLRARIRSRPGLKIFTLYASPEDEERSSKAALGWGARSALFRMLIVDEPKRTGLCSARTCSAPKIHRWRNIQSFPHILGKHFLIYDFAPDSLSIS